ncbi:pheromone a factor receptor [Cryptococcus wingfieldii CBS 7118]|uniref:Pheromone a factor receptor n=1 Tax=Cryptococcus wingfieldii CBS 7118 TaxID=1295528 RepID=A0A1E3JC10_9TREE|nr:pheromone a factor receptor [Cryptococcus wingfieldii CBS 7118]ODN98420.1 pheromone a factor receptor [Cryptococcus wingfieldii CBS 7118]
MVFANIQYLIPSCFALVCALYPLPWHLRTGNIATLTMIFWMALLNIVHIVNCVVWADNSDQNAKWWGDISALITVAYNFALPTAHLLLARQLESYTSLRPHSPLYDESSRRRHRLFDLAAGIAAPVVGVLVHLSNMDRRFYVVERFGPQPATYWNAWGVIWMAIVPILIAVACATYTIMALVNIHLRRQQMLSLIASEASINRDQFYRLMFLTLAELLTCGLRAIFNLMSFHNGPQPMGHRGPPEHNLRMVESLAWDQVKPSGRLVLNLSFFTVVACSYVFFLCFATSIETKRFYNGVLHAILPCLPEARQERLLKLGSVDTGFSHSAGTGTFTSTSSALATSKDVDISLEEMLGSPRAGQDGRKGSAGSVGAFMYKAPSVKTGGSTYDEETISALYLPPMLTEEKSECRADRDERADTEGDSMSAYCP